MSDPQVLVGIEVSKAQLDVALRPTDGGGPVNHDEAGIAGLLERLRTVQPTLVVLEATGGLAVPVTGALAAAGRPVVVVHPARRGMLPKPPAAWPRRRPSMPGGWRPLRRRCARRRGPCQRLRPTWCVRG